MTTSEIKSLFQKHEIAPNKLLGQNFLIDENILNKIYKTAAPETEGTILEVGPGIGALTYRLAETGARIVAVEKDPSMVRILRSELGEKKIENVEIVEHDILKLDTSFFESLGMYRVIANIPYYLTSRLIRKLLEDMPQPTEIIFTIQKEVAKRIIAKPPHMNLLALSVQAYGTPTIITEVSKYSFWPSPKVDSAILSIQNISKKKFREAEMDEKVFFRIVRAAFNTKRKTLANSLTKEIPKKAAENIIKNLGFNSTKRAEELSMEEWFQLIHALNEARDTLGNNEL